MENQSPNNHPQHGQTYDVLGGRAYVYRRERSRYWQAAAFLNGHNYRHSTKEEDIKNAIHAAEEWYISLRSQASTGTLPERYKPHEQTLAEVAEQFMKDCTLLTDGQRSPRWVEGHEINLRVHLLPFFGHLPISEVDSAHVQEYRVKRMTLPEEKNPHSKDNRPFKAKLPAGQPPIFGPAYS